MGLLYLNYFKNTNPTSRKYSCEQTVAAAWEGGHGLYSFLCDVGPSPVVHFGLWTLPAGFSLLSRGCRHEVVRS